MNGFQYRGIDETARVLAPENYLAAARSIGKGSVLVLGDDALSVMDPRDVGRRCRPPICILLAVPKFLPYARAAHWHEEAGAELVEPEDLAARVAQVATLPLRRFLSLSTWAPAPEAPDSIAMGILLAVPRLEDLSPAGLAAALGMEARRLSRACESRFGMSPRCLLWRYKSEYFMQRRAEGASVAAIAFELGYANKSNLHYALRAQGMRLSS